MNPLGLFLNLHTVYLAYSECLPTRLNPLAEGTRFSQVTMAENRKKAGLDEGFLSLPLPILLYMENPYSYKKFQ